MSDDLREQYLAYLKEHGLGPGPMPQNYPEIAKAAFEWQVEQARSAGDDSAVEMLRGIYEKYRALYTTMTPFQVMVDSASNAVEQSIRQIEKYRLAFKGNVFAGEFPTGSFNAEVGKADGGFLILVHSGTMNMLHQVAEAICPGDPNEPTADVNSEVIERIISLMVAYLRHKDSLFGPKPLSSPTLSPLPHLFSIASREFVVAHEYGHVLAGHLDDKALRLETLHTDAGDITVIKKDWQQELEADVIAFKILLGAEEYEDLKEKLQIIDQAYSKTERTAGVVKKAIALKATIAAPFIVFAIDHILSKTGLVVSGISAGLELTQLTDLASQQRRETWRNIIHDARHPPANMRMANLLRAVKGLEGHHLGYVNYPGILMKASDRICLSVAKALMGA